MYRVSFTPDALEQMEQLNKPVAQQVLKKLRWMAENFDQATHLPLTGNLKEFISCAWGIIGRFTRLNPTNKPSLSMPFNTGAKCIKPNKRGRDDDSVNGERE